jgi:hypothetical protein
VERVLVSMVRAAHERDHRVGGDCLSILIRRGHSRPRSRYLAWEPHSVVRVGTGDAMQVAYTPWIMSRGAAMAPMLVNGKRNFSVGGLEVQIDNPPVEAMRIQDTAGRTSIIREGFQSLPRPRPAGYRVQEPRVSDTGPARRPLYRRL